MSYHAYRPDLLTAIVSPEGCRVITGMLGRDKVEALLDHKNVHGELRRRITDTWDALHTVAATPEALGRVAVPVTARAEPMEAPAAGPIDAVEAGRRLGVSDARFRQLARERGVEPIARERGRGLYDPGFVAELAAERGLDKSQVAGHGEAGSGTKAA